MPNALGSYLINCLFALFSSFCWLFVILAGVNVSQKFLRELAITNENETNLIK